MKNTLTKSSVFALSLGFLLLTACGGSSTEKKVVTTVPNCSTSHHYDNGWYTDHNKTTKCTPTQALTNCLTGQGGQMVRMPIHNHQQAAQQQQQAQQNPYYQQQPGQTAGISFQYDYSFGYNYGNQNNSLNYYHQTPGQYSNQCIVTTSPNYQYVVAGYGYNYYNTYAAYNTVSNTYNYSKSGSYNYQLSPKETAIMIALGLIFNAAAYNSGN